jgi:hypothetical protein
MATKFALTLEFKNGGTTIFTHVVSADAAFPIPHKKETFRLNYGDPMSVLTEYIGDVEDYHIEISSNAASGLSIVNQLVTLVNSSSKSKP